MLLFFQTIFACFALPVMRDLATKFGNWTVRLILGFALAFLAVPGLDFEPTYLVIQAPIL